jgi:type II secretory pathway pseudopilin PulG
MRTKLAGKNLLFIELVVVILFFSIAAAACVMLFGQAYNDSNRSRDLTNAVIMAQNVAEHYKATGEILEIENIQVIFWQTQGTMAEINVYRGDEVIYTLNIRRIP